MANFSELRGHGAQHGRAQASETNPYRHGKLIQYGRAVSIGVAIVAFSLAGVILFHAKETTMAAHPMADHSNMTHMGHLLLTEWDVAGMNHGLSDEIKLGDSILEVHNDGQTVHRLAIWHGGEVQGDQVVGGTLVAETGFIQPGELALLDIGLEPGEYVLLCSVRGHTARGMYRTINLR